MKSLTPDKKQPSLPAEIVERIPCVNTLRGFAILGVIFGHICIMWFPSGWALKTHTGLIWLLLGSPVSNTWLAVNLFFVLSGFVLYLPYASGGRALRQRQDYVGFYQHRGRRLLPLFWLNVAISLMLAPRILNWDFAKEMALMFTGLYIFSWEYFIPKCNGVLWSLGIELCFSLIFPFVVLAFFRLGSARATYGIIVLSLAVRLFAVFTQAPVWHGVNPYLNYVRDSVFGRLDDFSIGMLVAHVFSRKPKYTVVADSAMILFGSAFVLGGATLWDLRMSSRLPVWSEAFYNIPVNIGFGLVLLGCLGLGMYGGRAIKFFINLSAFQMIGMMSYSLYVWHPLAINNMLDSGRNFRSISATVVIILLASVLSYRYIEFGSTKDINKIIPS